MLLPFHFSSFRKLPGRTSARGREGSPSNAMLQTLAVTMVRLSHVLGLQGKSPMKNIQLKWTHRKSYARMIKKAVSLDMQQQACLHLIFPVFGPLLRAYP